MKAYINSIAYYLPKNVADNENERLRTKTGIERRHVVVGDEIASDLAVIAAKKIFKLVSRDSVDYILFCTQSPDYLLPTTACILQDRLGLSKQCGALDYNHGCTGYIYGLGLAKGLIESGQASNVLLLTGETYSKYIHPQDQAVLPLFGDGASATLISGIACEENGVYGLKYGTDGSGFENLIVPVGGMRHRFQDTELFTTTDKYGNTRTNCNLFMNGGAIMDFTLDNVPKMLESILAETNIKREDISYCIFHQANQFMLKSLQKICGLKDVPYWNDIRNYGNTVSNSIPIAIVDLLECVHPNDLSKVLLMGFGVGLSWGGCIVDLSKIKVVS